MATQSDGKKEKLLDRFVDIISGIFQPILGIMAACGMIKGLNILFVSLHLYSDTCGGYMIINAIGEMCIRDSVPALTVLSAYKLYKPIYPIVHVSTARLGLLWYLAS